MVIKSISNLIVKQNQKPKVFLPKQKLLSEQYTKDNNDTASHRRRQLPQYDKDEKLVGIITASDKEHSPIQLRIHLWNQ